MVHAQVEQNLHCGKSRLAQGFWVFGALCAIFFQIKETFCFGHVQRRDEIPDKLVQLLWKTL